MWCHINSMWHRCHLSFLCIFCSHFALFWFFDGMLNCESMHPISKGIFWLYPSNAFRVIRNYRKIYKSLNNKCVSRNLFCLTKHSQRNKDIVTINCTQCAFVSIDAISVERPQLFFLSIFWHCFWMMGDQVDMIRKSKPILHDPNIIPRVKQVRKFI